MQLTEASRPAWCAFQNNGTAPASAKVIMDKSYLISNGINVVCAVEMTQIVLDVMASYGVERNWTSVVNATVTTQRVLMPAGK